MGYVSFFENFIQIAVLLFAWIVVLSPSLFWQSSSLSP